MKINIISSTNSDQKYGTWVNHNPPPFGMQIKNRAYTSGDKGYRYGFNRMERDDEVKGEGNSLDFGARIYECRLGRWLSTEPLFKKYPSSSPYVFCFNQVINTIDFNGKDVIVITALANGINHPTGHQAILIGNDKTGWYYYSYDKDHEDGKENNNFTSGLYFKSLEKFANSDHNTHKDDYDDGTEGGVNSEKSLGFVTQRYTQAFRITSDEKTDEKMKEAASKTFDKNYNLITNNCTHVIASALKAGGLKNGDYTLTRPAGNRKHADGAVTYEPDQYSYNHLPVSRHKEIEKSNQGIDVDIKIKRTTNAGNIRVELPNGNKYQQDVLRTKTRIEIDKK